jgi:5-methylcytosine-specific restriction protein B
VDGLFKRLCSDARADPGRRYYLVVDEINRGDVPRILGELFTALELDKRDAPIILPLSRQAFTLPRNVFLVGTMNTADRSIALLDTALRRRFAFVELMPDVTLLASGEGAIDVAALASELNKRIRQHVKRDAHNLQIGHAYFMANGRPVVDTSKLSRILQDDVIPLVQEYCYEDWDAMEQILGAGFIDSAGRAVWAEPFNSDDDLIAALRQLGEKLVRDQTAEDEPGAADDDDTPTVAVP